MPWRRDIGLSPGWYHRSAAQGLVGYSGHGNRAAPRNAASARPCAFGRLFLCKGIETFRRPSSIAPYCARATIGLGLSHSNGRRPIAMRALGPFPPDRSGLSPYHNQATVVPLRSLPPYSDANDANSCIAHHAGRSDTWPRIQCAISGIT